jgi:hypothetical protein
MKLDSRFEYFRSKPKPIIDCFNCMNYFDF